jgi:cytochrome c oxidase subunit 2
MQSTLATAEQAARSDVNMRLGVTDISHRVYDLHMLSLWICVAIGVVVFGVMFYSIFAHRKSKGAVASHFHESTKLEIAWTVAPFVILLFMAIPATKTLTDIYDTDDAALDIRITGYQWKWKYSYPKDGVEFFSSLRTPRDEINNLAAKGENYLLDVDEPLVIPAGQKVRFLVTAADVIHSWWMPDFSVKRDAIPGFVNETWTMVPEPGVYRGQCTELCGKDHGFMPIVVRVLPQDEFNSWLATRKEEAVKERELMSQIFTMEQSMERGKSVYEKACASCHQPNGEGIPGAFPALKGSALAMGPMEGHLDIVVHGKAGSAMAAFGAQLSEVDMAAVITYERNAWGNNVGDILQPIDVANFKKGK